LNYFCFRDDDFNGKIIGTRIPHQKCSSHVLNRTWPLIFNSFILIR
jgi:hypothetical protein